MSRLAVVDDLVAGFARQPRIRAGSLIITVYGDAIAPHGGTVWLGSLIRLLEALGLNQRLVRTSVFRLVKEGWLSAEQIGRRSYYSLTDAGRRRFETAFRHIYTGPHERWDGSWCLVLAHLAPPGAREAVRKELGWLGFGQIANGVLAHPMPDTAVLRATLADIGGADDVLVMQATTTDMPGARPHRALVAQAWALDDLADAYQAYLDRFRPLYAALRSARRIDPAQAFQARTLLIHEYRRITLRDPKLPGELLPAQWPGTAAYALTRNVYRLIAQPAEDWLAQVLETADGPLPATAASFYERFEGVHPAKA